MATNPLQVVISLALAVSACTALGQTTTVTATFAGTTVNLVIPQGHCVVPRDDPVGAIRYRTLEARYKGDSTVPLLFADCSQWPKTQADPRAFLERSGTYLFQLTNGFEQLVPATTTRVERVQAFVNAQMKHDGCDARDFDARMKERREMSSVQIPPPAPYRGGSHPAARFLFVGFLDRDDLALYAGTTYSFAQEGKAERGIGVIADTVVRRVPVQIVMYAPPGFRNAFEEALAQQKRPIRKLVAANE